MIEKIYNYTIGNEKVIEKIVDDEYSNINHVMLKNEDRLPLHFSNSNVYLIVITGTLTVAFNDEASNKYTKGNIVNVPYKTKMDVSNSDTELLEFFVVKAPNPRFYKD